MFTTGLARNVRARHALRGDFGKESEDHYHDYVVEWTCRSERLDEYGFALDISLMAEILTDELSRLQDGSLNDLDFFIDRQPSLEFFAVYLFGRFRERLSSSRASVRPVTMTVLIRETGDAWASFESDFAG